jgi:hypothetical protein
VNDNQVRKLTQDEYPLWDAIVEKSPQGTIFHSSAWIRKCSELLLKKGILYGFFKNKNLVGGCSIYSNQRLPFLSIATSTEIMIPYGGYIFSPAGSSKVHKNESSRNKIITGINNELIKTFDYINIRNSPAFIDIRPFIWNGWQSSVHYTYFLNLEGDFAGKISRKIHQTIRKSQKLGITFKKETDLDLCYLLIVKTYEKQHLVPPVSKNFIKQIIDLIISKNIGEMWVARTSTGEPAAAEIIMWDNKRAHRWIAASDAKFKNTGATSLLMFEIFQDLQTRGFREINLMCANEPYLAEFVSKFQPRLIPYYSVERSNSRFKLMENLKRISHL